jgi:putative nucleotidyltransferase with HDIG domain
MRIVSIDSLSPGTALAQTLVDDKGQVLLHRGVALTDQYIGLLRRKGYQHLYIRDEWEPDVEPEEDLDPIVRSRAVRAVREAYDMVSLQTRRLQGASVEDIVKAFSSREVAALAAPDGPLARMYDTVSGLLDAVLDRSTLAGLTSMKSRDSQLYAHSIDVCVVAIMVGRCIGLTTARMRQLATGALLHDIGKLFATPTKDAARAIRRHTVLGYELLRNVPDPDILAPHVAYQHHEHQDGTGLPRGVGGRNRIQRDHGGDGPQLALIAEAASVANAYDNLVSGMNGAPPVTPDVAVKALVEAAGKRYNREVVSAFRRVVPVYPRGAQVILRGGRWNNYLGVVCRVDQRRLDRPDVVLALDNRKRRVQPEVLCLVDHPDIHLRAVTC